VFEGCSVIRFRLLATLTEYRLLLYSLYTKPEQLFGTINGAVFHPAVDITELGGVVSGVISEDAQMLFQVGLVTEATVAVGTFT